MAGMCFTHVIYQTRRPVTVLSLAHRHNEGTRLVLDEHGRTFRHDDRDLLPITPELRG